MTALEIVSIEPTTRCSKACWFCYKHSDPAGEGGWTVDALEGFVLDLAANGVKAVSFGGGEPLEFDGIFDLLARLRGRLFRSLTTNGLPLDGATLGRLREAAPEKVHVSIHFPERADEVERVIGQVKAIEAAGIRSGINLVVARPALEAAERAAGAIRAAGIGPERVVYLPMRGRQTPTPAEMARVAGGPRFQSMSCLKECGKSPRFCSVAANRTAAWCSYTTSRRALAEPTWRGLVAALEGLPITFCGGTVE